MNITAAVTTILRDAGYETLLKQSVRPTLYFEDESILGAVFEFESPASLVSEWQSEQDRFLRENALALRRAGTKSWNVYCVFLCGTKGQQQNSIEQEIEEDFRGARKIAGLGVQTETDVVRALLPLLPIQNDVRTRDENIRRLLMDRLDLPESSKTLLGGSVSAVELIKSVSEKE